MRSELEAHGGALERYIGDAVMAVFGIPFRHEDDALRAVRAAAGMRDAIEPLKAGSALAMSVPSIGVLATTTSRLGIPLALAGPVAGFVVPDFWLARVTRVRSEAAVRELPHLLDLLRVSVVAGIPPIRAMDAVAAEFDGPSRSNGGAWRPPSRWGSRRRPRSKAWRRGSGAKRLRSFTDALIRSRRHGLPLAATLGTQAARAREARRRGIREHAARAGPKMQLVVALVLVPSMLLIVTAVLVSELRPVLGLN